MFKSSKGFTLVELIVVIAILAILAGVAIPVYNGYIKRANDAAVVTELDAIQTAAQAANATAGQVSKIEVRPSGTTATTVKVFGELKDEAYVALADNFGADFVLYYGSGSAAEAASDNSVTVTISKVILGYSYANGADWVNGDWEAK